MNRKGFTLVELIIVMTSLLVILAVVGKGFARLYRWYQKAETVRNLELIRNGLIAYYKTQAWDVDSTDKAELVVKSPYTSTTVADNTQMTSATAAVKVLSGTYINLPPADIERDGFGTPYVIRVSDRLGANGGNIEYHNIVIISAGPNKVIDSTFDPTTGQITVKGDDLVAVVGGESIETNKYRDTIKKLERYVRFLEDRYSLAYAADPTKSVIVDHFINSLRDGTTDSPYVDPNGFANTCTLSADCLALPTALGITLSTNTSTEDISSAWYYPGIVASGQTAPTYIYIDDDSQYVRSPDNGDTPPYSARVLTNTPWGTQIILTALGSISE